MAAWKRNFSFWSDYFLQTVLMILAGGAVAMVFVGMKLGSYFSFPEMKEILLGLMPVYWIILGGIILIIQITNLCKFAAPLAVGMSGTRREVIWWMNIMLAAVCLTMTLMSMFVWTLSGSGLAESSGELLQLVPAAGGIYLGECALGLLVGIIYVRWGKIGILIIAVTSGGFGAMMGIYLSQMEDTVLVFSELMDMIAEPWFWFAAGLLVFLVMSAVNRIAFRKMEVRV